MGYVCEWATGQCVYLENVGDQTRVTITNSSLGQQQQASSSLQTGSWTAPPEVLRSAIEIVVKLFTAQGERFIRIQGNSVSTSSEASFSGEAQPIPVQYIADMPASTMPPMTPMAPMPPLPSMKMGAMQMDQKAMTMQMGRMRVEMNSIGQSDQPPQASAAERSESATGQRNFCSQCGSAIKPSDRFCASCGHRLS